MLAVPKRVGVLPTIEGKTYLDTLRIYGNSNQIPRGLYDADMAEVSEYSSFSDFTRHGPAIAMHVRLTTMVTITIPAEIPAGQFFLALRHVYTRDGLDINYLDHVLPVHYPAHAWSSHVNDALVCPVYSTSHFYATYLGDGQVANFKVLGVCDASQDVEVRLNNLTAALFSEPL